MMWNWRISSFSFSKNCEQTESHVDIKRVYGIDKCNEIANQITLQWSELPSRYLDRRIHLFVILLDKIHGVIKHQYVWLLAKQREEVISLCKEISHYVDVCCSATLVPSHFMTNLSLAECGMIYGVVVRLAAPKRLFHQNYVAYLRVAGTKIRSAASSSITRRGEILSWLIHHLSMK